MFKEIHEVSSCTLYDLICFRCVSEGTIVDNSQLICLYLLARLLQRELEKCLRLVSSLPMDMEEYFGKRLKERLKVHFIQKHGQGLTRVLPVHA